VIDLHSHVLPGLDDGVETLAEAIQLARLSANDGVRALAATPHVRADYPTRPEEMEQGVEHLRRALAREGVALELIHGGELDLKQLPLLDGDALLRFSYGQRGRYVLLEFPYTGWPRPLESALASLSTAGLRALIAHPERNMSVQERPERLGPLVEAGALVQITAASVDGRLGRRTAAAARRLLELRLAHVLASDAHRPHVRAAGLAAAAAAVGDESLARYLTEDAPQAILAGNDPGAPPRAGIRRRFRLR
jgi:protein-tyrosine phosphatase